MRAFGGVGATLTIGIGFFIGCDQTSARAAFDCHVTDGHAPFHGQVADRFTAVFDHISGAASGAGFADHRHGDVLGRDTGRKFAGDFDLHVFRFLLDQGLRGQNVFDLGCADAVGQRAERTVGRGVAIAAHNGHARQGPALFGADDMHDPLPHVGHRVIVDAEILGVFIKCCNLNARILGHGFGIGAVQRRGHVMVRHGDGFVGCAHGAVRHAQALECLRAGHFVHKMAVDIQKAGAVIGLVCQMGIPDFVIERFGGHGPLP